MTEIHPHCSSMSSTDPRHGTRPGFPGLRRETGAGIRRAIALVSAPLHDLDACGHNGPELLAEGAANRNHCDRTYHRALRSDSISLPSTSIMDLRELAQFVRRCGAEAEEFQIGRNLLEQHVD